MLSLSQFRTQVFPLFSVMKKTGLGIDVVYKGVVYEVSVRRTKKVPKLTRAKYRRRLEIQPRVDAAECPKCGYLSFSGVCMNPKCGQVTNNPGS